MLFALPRFPRRSIMPKRFFWDRLQILCYSWIAWLLGLVMCVGAPSPALAEDCSPQLLQTLSGHRWAVNSVAFSPNGGRVLTGSGDWTAKLWDAGTGQLIHTFKHDWDVMSVAFSPDGRSVLTGSGDPEAKLWDASTGEEIRSFKHGWEGTSCVVFSPDGTKVVTAGGGYDTRYGKSFMPKAKIWDARTGELIRTLRAFESRADSYHPRFVDVTDPFVPYHAFSSVAFSPDGRQLLTGTMRMTATKLWDIETGEVIRTFDISEMAGAEAVAFSPDGSRLVVSGNRYGTAELWDAISWKRVRTLHGHTSRVNSVAFSPDGRWVLTGSNDDTAKLWDTRTGHERCSIRHDRDVTSVAFSPDGSKVLTGSGDRVGRIWDFSDLVSPTSGISMFLHYK